MLSKQKQVKVFLYPVIVSAITIIMVFSMQQASALGCDQSCDSLVKIDGIKIGKIDDNKILSSKDDNKILSSKDDNKVQRDSIEVNPDGILSGSFDGDKISIKELNVLIDGDNNNAKIQSLHDNDTYVTIKDFKILIPQK